LLPVFLLGANGAPMIGGGGGGGGDGGGGDKIGGGGDKIGGGGGAVGLHLSKDLPGSSKLW
jgi:hypothetical protein